MDTNKKKKIYQHYRVPEYWLVYPEYSTAIMPRNNKKPTTKRVVILEYPLFIKSPGVSLWLIYDEKPEKII
ncbi:hypothetical protein MBAV_004870 [Candidatus Magnetobacterium bavaricum]|uniref:Restriction endonuclease n=1 Tax=Candidatus Magnetobacterium bavaricum TaxID=29290 RepID=A0A0F3GM88_9BACT|nr:hypothetical protein MBAV_004870 [Candidatus Magnetobacterium bavaricum]